MPVSLNTTHGDAVHIGKLVAFFEKLRKKASKSGGSPGFLDTAVRKSQEHRALQLSHLYNQAFF